MLRIRHRFPKDAANCCRTIQEAGPYNGFIVLVHIPIYRTTHFRSCRILISISTKITCKFCMKWHFPIAFADFLCHNI